jgi:two-component system response regulator MtrA
MIVDDDHNVLRLLNRILKPEGYRVVTVDNSRLAPGLFTESTPDLVILDIMMPGLDGFHVLDFIRKQSDVPVIMLTARDEVITVRDALVLGADDYVRKPFCAKELLARIQAKLRRAQQQTNNYS